MTSVFPGTPPKKFILALILSCAFQISCASRVIWRVDINGSANDHDAALALSAFTNGDVVAAGWTRNQGTDHDFTVVKLDGATGAATWRQTINGGLNQDDQALKVAVDANGEVLAAGYTRNVSGDTNADFTVVKFDGPTGNELWRQVINGPANHHDVAYGVTTDMSEDVIVSGQITHVGTGSDFTVLKFERGTGKELWRRVINGKANGWDSASSVRSDGKGNVVVTGRASNQPNVFDSMVIKLNAANGKEVWRRILPGTVGNSSGLSVVAVNKVGDVMVAGHTVDFDLAVIRFDGRTGAELWRGGMNGTSGRFGSALAAALDADGNIIVVGYIRNADTANDFVVLKLDGLTGKEMWRRVINGFWKGEDQGSAVAVDNSGDVVAVGFIALSGIDHDFAVIKFDGATGRRLWRHLINGSYFGNDFATAVVVDTAGDVIVAGGIRNAETGLDFTVIKLRGY